MTVTRNHANLSTQALCEKLNIGIGCCMCCVHGDHNKTWAKFDNLLEHKWDGADRA